MKKLYLAIVIIAVSLFISCELTPAKKEIKKAFTKITDSKIVMYFR